MTMEKKDLTRLFEITTRLSEPQKLELIAKLSSQVAIKQNQREVRLKTKTWMDMAGVGAEIWQSEDAQEYVRQERASWRD